MLQLVTIALFALTGFSSVANAAPTHNSLMNDASPMANTPIGIMNSVPINWKRDHHQQDESLVFTEAFIKSAVAEAMSKQNMMMIKRDDAAPGIDLSSIFRGVFDKIVDHIIEVTPLNDIVHGNYDFLYDIFLTKIGEAVSGTGAPAEDDPTNTTSVTNSTAAAGDSTATKKAKPTKDTSVDNDDEDNDDEDNDDEDNDDEDDEEDEDEDEDEDDYEDDDEEDYEEEDNNEDWEEDEEEENDKSWNEDKNDDEE